MTSRVLFVCIGNAIRSQMAEGFARVYGNGAIAPASAGLDPANTIDPNAVRLMEDIGIDISGGFPKHFLAMSKMPFELIVNISGYPLPSAVSVPVVEWNVEDPVGGSEDEYRRARDLIQKLTLGLIDQVRASSVTRNASPGVPEVPATMVLDRRRRLKRSEVFDLKAPAREN